MQNDPELNGKYLGTITKDFVQVSDTLKEASYQIRKRDISKYPIFVFSRDVTKIGGLLIGAQERDLEWNINASYLEDFVNRQLVAPDKVEEFEQAYRDADEYCCLFVVDRDFMNFVFVPYPED
ncbi:hypothetical protein EFA69_05580 [Rufibacter immobilis]|uniref:Uncharacterized protein n=1 Tax=Rufibacter immobilis TaxID=1348778 RepID=A0A3M9N2G6_9BACT|nr:hypothetical protein [Rufibacter immobilis]RNI31974.1 hypothetical protein EFA69_05580 [Rufibacter immobilis]